MILNTSSFLKPVVNTIFVLSFPASKDAMSDSSSVPSFPERPYPEESNAEPAQPVNTREMIRSKSPVLRRLPENIRAPSVSSRRQTVR